MDSNNWKTQLHSDFRQRVVNKIIDNLKKHVSYPGQENFPGMEQLAVKFEEKTYVAATSQEDYLRKISMKMMSMETKSQNIVANSLPPNSSSGSKTSQDAASSYMQSQIANQGQQLQVQMGNTATEVRQRLLSQSIQNNIAASSTPTSVSSLPSSAMPNVVGQSPNLPGIHNVSGISAGTSQNLNGDSMRQGVSSSVFPNSPRQMQGRHQVGSPQQQPPSQNPQQQPPSQNPQPSPSQNPQQHYNYQPQLLKQKYPHGSVQHSVMQSRMQQQTLNSTQLQSSQQLVMQPSKVQSAPMSGLHQSQQSSLQNSTQSVLQQNPQAVFRQQQPPHQTPMIQQQASLQQQSLLSMQQQVSWPQPNSTNIQVNQLIGENSNPDMQQQQQQRLLGQQNNLSNLQHHQHMGQANKPHMHQQKSVSQNNVAGLQQQPPLGNQSGSPNSPANQHSSQILQQSKIPSQKHIQAGAGLSPNQGHHSQSQTLTQHLMTQMQSQSGQMQQHLGFKQKPGSLQRDMQQIVQTSGPSPQSHNLSDQQNQLIQSQGNIPEASSDSTAQTGNANSGDWQEEIYQKIVALRETYFPELSEIYHKFADKIQQQESHPQPRNDAFERIREFKNRLEKLIAVLKIPKSSILPGFNNKLIVNWERQIIHLLSTHKTRKPGVTISSQGQRLPSSQMQQPVQQSQQQHSQSQAHLITSQMNSQVQSMTLPNSAGAVKLNNMSGLQQNSLSPLSGMQTVSQNMGKSLAPSSSSDSGQGNSMNTLQHVSIGSQQQGNANLSSQAGTNLPQPSIGSFQTNTSLAQQHHLKQRDHQMLQTQQPLKVQIQQQQQQKQMQQLLQRQQLLQHQVPQQQQVLHQPTKKQQATLLDPHHMSQLHQIADVNDLKTRQQMGINVGGFQQHQSVGQRSVYHQQQHRAGVSFPSASPQLFNAVSPQLSQNLSPDQQNMLTALSKIGTPLQSASSPFVVPSPSTPLVPSPMPGDPEKISSEVLVHPNAGNSGNQQIAAATSVQSMAINTPGISASPLLGEFTSPENHGNVSTAISDKSSVQKPFERLLKAVKSMSSKALSASVSDIHSVVSMMDGIAGSAPTIGSRAGIGENLVDMTRYHLQAISSASQDGATGTRKMKRHMTAVPFNVPSAGTISDSFKTITGCEASDIESTATSSVKKPRNETNNTLLEEMKEINYRLIDTVVNISDEDIVDPMLATTAAEKGDGTIVKCSFIALAPNHDLKLEYGSLNKSQIQPIRLLVPANYPNCSPILLDKLPIEEESCKEVDNLSSKVKARFRVLLRDLSHPTSLHEIVRTWDGCARAAILKHAEDIGGGSFSSIYGAWDNCSTTT
ncbi:mediator of RNA polymerase II transcription subunit 15a-like [Impatiens glandulifera]|uniref:mediator of RNA polymerase II transcription subunit 15a-like n=1 Tax=Impatiens glandulifera TaxID=253017 RepID=UPI001FB18EC5|nr:mediator of RNA polymerase II transcription subunit 15a-like [Impatiens glandulifera]